MARKLATVQTVSALYPIPGADRIELARILGWQVVVKKGELSVGDKVVYFEVDSILPASNPAFSFLVKNGKIKPLKSTKILGVLSQGLAMPLKDVVLDDESYDLLSPGDDLTSILEVEKYDPPEFDGKGALNAVGSFPDFIHKTDEERVQNMEDTLIKLRGLDFVVTEKLDGTSMTLYWKDGALHICSRNQELSIEDNNKYTHIVKKYNLTEKLKELREELGSDFAIQGELIGMGIQSNKYKLNTCDLYVFNVINLDTQEEFGMCDGTPWSIPYVCNKLGLKSVPVLGVICLHHTSDILLDMAKGVSTVYNKQIREGLVLRLKNKKELPSDLVAIMGRRCSFKAINNDFLVK